MSESSTAASAALLGDAAWRGAVAKLHGSLDAAGYRRDMRNPTGRSRVDLLFDPWTGWRELGRVAPEAGDADRLAFFHRTQPLSEDRVARLLAELPDAPDADSLERAGVVERESSGQLRSRVRFFPTGAFTVVSDGNHLAIPDFVYVGADSRIFAERLRRALSGRRFPRALDLCSGSGIQGLTALEFAERVEGTDLNPRAVAFARFNAELLGASGRATFDVENLAEGREGPYDLIVANPPFVWLEPELRGENLHAHGGELGLEVSEKILADLDRLLGEHGEARMIAESPVVRGDSALVSLCRRVLGSTSLGAEFTLIRHRAPRAYQRDQGCSHIDYFDVCIARDLPTGVRVRRPRWPAYVASLVHRKWSNRTRGRSR